MRIEPRDGQDDATAAARAFVERLDASDVDLTGYEVDLVAGLLRWFGSFTAGQHGEVEKLRRRYEEDLPPVARVHGGPAPAHDPLVRERKVLAAMFSIDLAQPPEEVRRAVREALRSARADGRRTEALERLKELLP